MGARQFEYPATCRTCGKKVVPAYSPKDAQYALLGEFPGKSEIETHIQFSGRSGIILRRELARLEIDIDGVFLGSLWYHEKNDNEACLNNGLGALLKALRPIPNVLLMGTEVSQMFLGSNATAVSGIWMTSKILPNHNIMATVNPASLLGGGGIGEFRLALELFFGKRKRQKHVWREDLLRKLA